MAKYTIAHIHIEGLLERLGFNKDDKLESIKIRPDGKYVTVKVKRKENK